MDGIWKQGMLIKDMIKFLLDNNKNIQEWNENTFRNYLKNKRQDYDRFKSMSGTSLKEYKMYISLI